MKTSRILLKIQNMAQGEIESLIDPSKLAEIKRKDKSPLFKVFSIAHEGISNGTVIGLGKIALRWMQNAVKKIHEKLSIGTKIFVNHISGTNDHTGRPEAGEVVGKAIKTIKERINTLMIAYIKPEFSSKKLDCASFEGDVTLPENIQDDSVITPDSIGEITGIAIGNSSEISPAFDGATLQGALQMMSEKPGEKMITIEDVLAFLKENKVKPSSVFDVKDLKSDKAIEQIIKDGNQNTYYHVERLKGEAVKKDTKIKELEEGNQGLSSSLLKINSHATKKKILESRKINERMAKFIDAKYDEFVPTTAEKLESDLNSFVDTKVDEFKGLQEAGIIGKDDNIDVEKNKGIGENKKTDTSKNGYGEDLAETEQELMGKTTP